MPVEFEILWRQLQRDISAGDTIRNWTQYGGNLGDNFTVCAVGVGFVEVDTPEASGVQHISREEFAKVYDHWDSYNEGSFPRNKLRDKTRYSKYIISILHHITENR